MNHLELQCQLHNLPNAADGQTATDLEQCGSLELHIVRYNTR